MKKGLREGPGKMEISLHFATMERENIENTTVTPVKHFVTGDDGETLLNIWNESPKPFRHDEDEDEAQYSNVIDYDISKKEMRVYNSLSGSVSCSHSETALFYDEPGKEAMIYGDTYGTTVWFIRPDRRIALPSTSEDIDTRFVRLGEIEKIDDGFDIFYRGVSCFALNDEKHFQMRKRVFVDRILSETGSASGLSSEHSTPIFPLIFPFVDQGRPKWDSIDLPVVLLAGEEKINLPVDVLSNALSIERKVEDSDTSIRVHLIGTYRDRDLDYRFADPKRISLDNSTFGQLDLIEMIDGIEWTYNIRSFPAQLVDMFDDKSSESSCTGRVLICFHTFNIYASAENDIMVKIPILSGLECSNVSVKSEDEIVFGLGDHPLFGQTINLSQIIEASKFNDQIVRVMKGVWINGESMEVNIWPDTLDMETMEDQNLSNEEANRDQDSSIYCVFGNYYPKNQILHMTYKTGMFIKKYYRVSYKCQMFGDSLISLVHEPFVETDRDLYSRDKTVLSPEAAAFLEKMQKDIDPNDSPKDYFKTVKRIVRMADRRGLIIEDVFSTEVEELIKDSARSNVLQFETDLKMAEDLKFNKVVYVIRADNHELSQNAVHSIEPTFSEAQFSSTECRVFHRDRDDPEIIDILELVGRPLRRFREKNLLSLLRPSAPIRMESGKSVYVISVWGPDVDLRSQDQEFVDTNDKLVRTEYGSEPMNIFTRDNTGWVWDEDQDQRCPKNKSFRGHYVEVPESMSKQIKSITVISESWYASILIESREFEPKIMPVYFDSYIKDLKQGKTAVTVTPNDLKTRYDDDDIALWRLKSLECTADGVKFVLTDYRREMKGVDDNFTIDLLVEDLDGFLS
jgi:hypothetical protein